MVSTKSVRNVLRMVTAGKEEAPAGAPVMPAAPETPVPGTTPGPSPVVQQPETKSEEKVTNRIYFFSAPKDKAIPFKDIDGILKSNNNSTKQALIENLKGGNTAASEHSADYFVWKKIAVSTDMYSKGDKKWLVYEADLSLNGTKVAASVRVTPEDMGKTVENVEADLSLYDKKNGIEVISVDTSNNAVYINIDEKGNIPSNLTQTLLTGSSLSGMTYEQFKLLFGTYRVWSVNTGRLVLPDFNTPPPELGVYAGGAQEYSRVVAPAEQKMLQEQQKAPQQPSLGDQERNKQQEEERRYIPVDEQANAGVAPVQGQYIDTPVGGGNRMAAHNINSVRRVLLGYFKGAIDTVQPSTMNTTNTTKRKPLYVSDKSQENAALGATLTQYARTQADLEKKTDQLTKNMAQRAQSMGRL